jgi:hypothetical protein
MRRTAELRLEKLVRSIGQMIKTRSFNESIEGYFSSVSGNDMYDNFVRLNST